MATILKNLSEYDESTVNVVENLTVGIVVSEWNREITDALTKGAVNTLLKHGVREENIKIKHVPGSFELPQAAYWMAKTNKFNAIICLGCVIQGETRHFDFICDAVANGIMKLNIKNNIPFIFGVLTPENQQQALDRAGGKHGNKGDEAAIAAIKMTHLKLNC